MKLLLLLAIVTTCFTSISFGQVIPIPTNTITRNACLPGYIGCYNGAITLKTQSSGVFVTSTTVTYPAATTYSASYSAFESKITITIAGLSSTGNYLPVNIGDQIYVGLDDGIHHNYGVIFTKTADYQFSMSVSDNAY